MVYLSILYGCILYTYSHTYAYVCVCVYVWIYTILDIKNGWIYRICKSPKDGNSHMQHM